MAHLDSKHTLTINLSNYQPQDSNVSFITREAIQGNTVVTFLLSGIQADVRDFHSSRPGFNSVEIDFGDPISNGATRYSAKFRDMVTDTLPFTSISHTYFTDVSTYTTLSANIAIKYEQVDQNTGPLSATHIIEFRTTPENIVDRNIEILNSQLFTIGGSAVPYFNVETDENIIYPLTYFDEQPPSRVLSGVYLNTDPEDRVQYPGDYFLTRTELSPSSALSAFGDIALSGSGFQLQGRTGRQYSFAFSISGDITPTAGFSSTSLINYADIDLPSIPATTLETGILSTYTTFFDAITAGIDNLGIIGAGNEFTNILTGYDPIKITFNHTNLLPPDATVYTYGTVVSAGIVPGTTDPINIFLSSDTDFLYTYPTSGFGLSAVNRVITSPDGDNITAL
jgi:hypothetical protein